jgi:hypothetical protein
MRTVFLSAAACALLSVGCGGATTAAPNNVLNASVDEKTKVEDILKQYGINKKVVAMRDNGDFWHVSVDDPPAIDEKAAEGKPKVGSVKIPDEYKVFKDGRVHKAFDDKPLTKK